MRRRGFIGLLGGAATWPLAARAQQAAKLPIIGLLTAGAPSTHGQWVTAFVHRLRELGWIEGRTIAIEYRWGEGRDERYSQIAAEFVELNVKVIVTQGAAVAAAMKATSSIPIVFTVAADPLGSGFVTSLSRPGANVTGLSLQFTDLAGKRLQLMRDAIPSLRRLAIMANVSYRAAMLESTEVQTIARTLGLDVTTSEIRQSQDLGSTFDVLKGRAEALYVVTDPLVNTNRFRINTWSLAARIPTMHGVREHVEIGGLMSYGANFSHMFRRGAEYVDKILRGATPASLPVEQPTKFDLVINSNTAKALGLEIPPTLLARADEVIE